jgi:hypothetical protein
MSDVVIASFPLSVIARSEEENREEEEKREDSSFIGRCTYIVVIYPVKP